MFSRNIFMNCIDTRFISKIWEFSIVKPQNDMFSRDIEISVSANIQPFLPILVSADIYWYFWPIPIFCLKIRTLLIPSQQLCFWDGACAISKKNDVLLLFFSSAVKHNQYHHSHILSSHYLTPICASIDIERIFSTNGDVVTPERNLLLPENVRQILYLHENVSFLRFNY